MYIYSSVVEQCRVLWFQVSLKPVHFLWKNDSPSLEIHVCMCCFVFLEYLSLAISCVYTHIYLYVRPILPFTLLPIKGMERVEPSNHPTLELLEGHCVHVPVYMGLHSMFVLCFHHYRYMYEHLLVQQLFTVMVTYM